MVGQHHNIVIQWIVTILLECGFMGFCVVFIGAGIEGLRKKKHPVKNLTMIIAGIVMAILSLIATFLLLHGRT